MKPYILTHFRIIGMFYPLYVKHTIGENLHNTGINGSYLKRFDGIVMGIKSVSGHDGIYFPQFNPKLVKI